ncbi:hypothetical protein ALC62_14787 [Cyphomyrmex costatus]|uniref:CCHC-type domain-containing protein n=1 Tax=Cyphomyrmex costatus TaxID=456900 RepID=A0A151I8D3_9HYME|nr:hypothetical protein ALC62_14787 [Cyphomyrmex costatus]
MHRLQVSEKIEIKLLFNGINSASLRASAAVLQANTLDEFIHLMQEVTTSFAANFKKSPTPIRKGNSKVSPSSSTNTTSSPTKKPQAKIDKDIICAYCKKSGHIKKDCYKLKRKEEVDSLLQISPLMSVKVETKNTSTTVGCVDIDSQRRFEIKDSVIEINSINGSNCNLSALVDTGSKVSFIKPSIAKIFLNQQISYNNPCRESFKALNNTKIEIIGSVQIEIGFSYFPNDKAKANLLILEDENWSPTHFLLGLDFLKANELTLICDPSNFDNNNLVLLKQVASVETLDISDKPWSEAKTDFGETVDHKLITVLEDVHNTPVDIVKDEYCVKVNLKD